METSLSSYLFSLNIWHHMGCLILCIAGFSDKEQIRSLHCHNAQLLK